MDLDHRNEDTCVCCGEPVPEGRQVCWQCEHGRTVAGRSLTGRNPVPSHKTGVRQRCTSAKSFIERNVLSSYNTT